MQLGNLSINGEGFCDWGRFVPGHKGAFRLFRIVSFDCHVMQGGGLTTLDLIVVLLGFGLLIEVEVAYWRDRALKAEQGAV